MKHKLSVGFLLGKWSDFVSDGGKAMTKANCWRAFSQYVGFLKTTIQCVTLNLIAGQI